MSPEEFGLTILATVLSVAFGGGIVVGGRARQGMKRRRDERPNMPKPGSTPPDPGRISSTARAAGWRADELVATNPKAREQIEEHRRTGDFPHRRSEEGASPRTRR